MDGCIDGNIEIPPFASDFGPNFKTCYLARSYIYLEFKIELKSHFQVPKIDVFKRKLMKIQGSITNISDTESIELNDSSFSSMPLCTNGYSSFKVPIDILLKARAYT